MNVFIYGSCVSRDTFEYLESPVTLVRYVARQSLISAGVNSQAAAADAPTFDSRFQQRQSDSDLRGDLYRQLAHSSSNVDAVVVDLVDERGGLYILPGQDYITRTPERVQRGGDSTWPDRLPFGSATHFALWQEGFRRFRDELTRHQLWERTICLAIPWAERTRGGEDSPASFGMTAAIGNRAYRPYYAAVQDAGLRLCRPKPRWRRTHSDANNKWGLAPFHYADDVYENVANQLDTWLRALDKRKSAPPDL